MKTIRWSTFLRDFGPVKKATYVNDADWKRAISEGRFATVYHGESDWNTPLQAIPRRHGFVNTICKIVFEKPLPEGIEAIVGMRDSETAFETCNLCQNSPTKK